MPESEKRIFLSRFLARLVGSKLIVRTLSRLNVLVYRWSSGRLMNSVDGAPVCLLTMTGRKTGKIKTVPLMYTEFEDQVLLVASLGGSDSNPVWYYNLKSRPQIEIQIGALKRKMRVTEASPEQRDKLWPIAVTNFPSYAEYQRKTRRVIPILVCTPY